MKISRMYMYELALLYNCHPVTISRDLKRLNQYRAKNNMELLDIPKRGYLSEKIVRAYVEHYGEPG